LVDDESGNEAMTSSNISAEAIRIFTPLYAKLKDIFPVLRFNHR